MNALNIETDIESALIGAFLNNPDAFAHAPALRPDFFENPIYSLAYLSMSEGDFNLATVIADCKHVAGAEDLLYAAWDMLPAANLVTLVDKIVDRYKRRELFKYMHYIEKALEGGRSYAETMAEYGPCIDALSTVGNVKTRFQPVAIDGMEVIQVPWIVKGVMPARGLGFLAGASGAGKSFLMLHTALSAAAGRSNVMGWPVKRAGCVYVAAEDFAGCQKRVMAWKLRHPYQGCLPFELIDGPVNLLDEKCVEELARALEGAKARMEAMGERLGLVVIDTLSRCLPGASENDSTEMSRAIEALGLLERRSGAFVCVVHHFGKAGAQAGLRGWSGLNAASDMTITVERDPDEPKIRTATLVKIKNGIDGAKVTFKLDRVGLGVFDEDGDEADSCVVVQLDNPDIPKRVQGIKLTPTTQMVLDAIKWATDNCETGYPPMDLPRQPWSRSVSFMDVKTRLFTVGFEANATEGQRLKWLNRGLDFLSSQRMIGRDTREDSLWLI